MKDVLFINPNLMKPPVAPIAIDYLASALRAAGFQANFLDLVFEDDIDAALQRVLKDEFLYIGVTIRNIDDSFFATKDFCLARIKPVIKQIKELTNSPIVLGGVAYSIFPRETLDYLGADYGISGDGEAAVVALARTFAAGQAPHGPQALGDIPGLVRRERDMFIMNPPAPVDLATIDLSDRSTVNNMRYFKEGGMVGFETKRGCACSCSYCADPLAKGSTNRLRPPDQVARELAGLAERGITHFHTCDSEFNVPPSHAADVSRAIIHHGLGTTIRWHAYMNPAYFSADLADVMRRAGCAGINFGSDHVNPGILNTLGRTHTADSLRDAALLCRKNEMASMFDLLLGAPGETPETLREAIDFMKGTEASCIGASLGLRLYPGTRLTVRLLASAKESPNGFYGLDNNDGSLLRPTYYLSPLLGENPYGLLSDLVKGDERFFVASPERQDNDYNYNDNSVLSEAIRSGRRGAFWDILRQMKK